MYKSRIYLLSMLTLSSCTAISSMTALKTSKLAKQPIRRMTKPTTRSFTAWLRSVFVRTPLQPVQEPNSLQQPSTRSWADYFKQLFGRTSSESIPALSISPLTPTVPPSAEQFKHDMLAHINAMRNSFYSTEYTNAWRQEIVAWPQFINTLIPHQRIAQEPLHEKTVLQITLEMLTQYHEQELHDFIATAHTLPYITISDAIYETCHNSEKLIQAILNREGTLGSHASQILSELLKQMEIIKIYEKRAISRSALSLAGDEAGYFDTLLNTIETILKQIARLEAVNYETLHAEAHQLVARTFAYHLLQLEPNAPWEAIDMQYKKLMVHHDPSHILGQRERKEAQFASKELYNAFKRLKKYHQQNHVQFSQKNTKADL